jgi:hypothetical protein
MALTKKGARRIVVDGVEYRWVVRRKPSYSQGIGSPLTFVVELFAAHGAVLVVTADDARPDNWLGLPSITILPAQVASCIRTALADGWQPAQPGPPFRLGAGLGTASSTKGSASQ